MSRHSYPRIPRSLGSIVAEHLEKEILEGRFKPGERLIEQKWAARFGVSRGSFREVLRILANAGLVEILPRRGARVRIISKRDIEEIYFLRKHLESIAAAKATENMSDERLAQFKKLLRRMEEAAKRSDLTTYLRYNLAFREKILEVTGSERLRRVLDYLGKPALRYRYLGLELPGRMTVSLKAHQDLVRAFAQRSSQSAANVMFELIETGGQAIVNVLGHPDGSV